MKKYEENILDKSTWITQTPTTATTTLPFFITEAGHFYAESNYSVHRDFHDSFLFLYTLKGSGQIQSANIKITLNANSATLIDCHEFHSYSSLSSSWEFIWIHMKGAGVRAMYHLIYPEGISAIHVSKELLVYNSFFEKNIQYDVLSSAEASAQLHALLNTLFKCRFDNQERNNNMRYGELINNSISIIQEHFSAPLAIDDILTDIPVSKYHFIRIFKQVMGITPYQYLTNYRINMAKILLRSEDISISEVAERCGFSDTSNFINQFKKHTAQKPLEYKRYFL
jgi:AraC-like DNA-binding protein